jgi:CubicO group peptidase (beta-lactamase class C family)
MAVVRPERTYYYDYGATTRGTAWGLFSSTEDLARFVRWQLNEQDQVIALSHQPLPRQHQGYALLANDTCEGTEGALQGLAASLPGRSGADARPP